jgi:hypothetical protein
MRILGDRPDQAGDLRAEALEQVGQRDIGSLDDVVQQAGGHDLVRRAGVVEQLGDLHGVGDERNPVEPAHLAPVRLIGIGPSGL